MLPFIYKHIKTSKGLIKITRDRIVSFLFPGTCVACSKRIGGKQFLCSACQQTFSFLSLDNVCRTCLSSVPGDAGLCGSCLNTSPAYEKLISCCSYSGEIRAGINRFKFHDCPDMSVPFGRMMCARLDELGVSHFDAVVPVPLSRKRFIERGFNQAELLAKRIASHFNVPCFTDVLKKPKETQRQSELHRDEREKNVRGAYALENGERVRDKCVLLVDDVFTTGATLRETARILSCTTLSVIACTIARTEDRFFEREFPLQK